MPFASFHLLGESEQSRETNLAARKGMEPVKGRLYISWNITFSYNPDRSLYTDHWSNGDGLDNPWGHLLPSESDNNPFLLLLVLLLLGHPSHGGQGGGCTALLTWSGRGRQWLAPFCWQSSCTTKSILACVCVCVFSCNVAVGFIVACDNLKSSWRVHNDDEYGGRW